MIKVNAIVFYGTAFVLTADIFAWMYYFFKAKNYLKEKDRAEKKIVYQVLFFPDKHIPCRRYLLTAKGCHNQSCTFSHNDDSSFVKLIRQILNAKRSIDLCMFSITCYELAEAILIKYRQGASVRFITDSEYMNLKGSQVHQFQIEGIPIRHNRSNYLMHHKFLVIDSSTVITGSFNWTQSAVIGNHENVLVTNHPDVSQSYKQEFQQLWNRFCPENGDAFSPNSLIS